ncbi:hypothetical protein DL93DRAFT_2212032 [Clavulina sp. PMI_390]|nr:hypothetical protein DL93DRAFT_2212032 [Clavulina sp. PMI_390]
MMEQLAERRMLREDSAVDDIEGTSDEDSDLDDDGEGDEDEDSDEDPMTDEQKMEEGKRMFSIFAARMFESRVLTAYREKVAQDRQLQLIRELEDEALAAAQKDAKKQSSNQKKKDKKKYAIQLSFHSCWVTHTYASFLVTPK